ncbi:S-adenosyl-L-methionine-dependent methyltransferase [Lactarius vividus]|nr:S-adenosyl-L-methionine-dependent methyltransferase [Lactarius vividus]
MTRSKKHARRKKPRNEKEGDTTVVNDEKREDHLQKSDMQNSKFEAYYRKQLPLDDEEWSKFMDTFREPLPSTFRIAGGRETAAVLTSVMEKTYIPHLSDVEFEDQLVPPPIPIPWYPKGLAWQLNVPKRVLRKSPEFKRFHSFLVFETEVGNITRQEAVSMLPPLFLDVQPHHLVLDMCAAPGSKTSQLLESLHSSQSLLESSVPPGLLIANDSDPRRTQLLIHQTARLPSPAFVVTNLDASIFPTLYLPRENTRDPESSRRKVRQPPLLFDRILCDVPCSGDGTIRKNVEIWRRWSPMDGNGIHPLQLRILQRAMRMLRQGGRIVYSTCSLNPVENEAVIAEALRTSPGFELVDVSDSLPALVRRPGLKHWFPSVSRDLQFFDSYDEYAASPPDGKGAARLAQSHWPPTEDFNLDRCIRVYPHLQDTGGFFLAVLQHKQSRASPKEGKRPAQDSAEIPDVKKARRDDGEDDLMTPATEPAKSNSDQPTDPTSAGTSKAAQDQVQRQEQEKTATTGDNGFRENPFTFISPDDPTVESCMQLSLASDFPTSNLLVRNPAGEPARSLYLTNDLVRAVFAANDYKRIRIISAGTKIFMRQEGGFGRGSEAVQDGAEKVPRFRLLSEGLSVVLPYVKPESIVDTDVPTLRRLLEAYYPLLSAFDDAFRREVGDKPTGSHVVRFKAGDIEGASLSHDLVLPLWKSPSSLSLMLDKRAKSALSLRVFGEDITVAGRQAAAAIAERQGTSKKENEEKDVPPGLEDTSFLRQTDGTTEGVPELKNGEEREDEFVVIHD